MGFVGLISEAPSGICRNRARLPDGGDALSGLHIEVPMGL